jgi:4-methyl-5(b-hydroxyethyl)-thiazole monophosphate biosynthesis
MPKTLIPLAEGFEEIETLTVVDVLRRAGITVVLAGLQTGPVASVRKVNILPDESLDAISIDDFDMIILPGGQPGTDNLCADVRIKRLLTGFNEAGKQIAAICAATTVLAEAGLITGKRVTTYPSYKDKLNGALYVDNPVVSDKNIITSQGPGTAIAFALAIVTRLAGKHAADAIACELLVNNNEQQQLVWDRYLFNSTVQSLVEALEMKDSYTQGHAKRVTDLSLSIGAKLNLSAIEMRDLYLGAMLHDIGKVATEHDILSKVESLNLREETLIREHPIKGALLIVGIDNLNSIVPTILHHHERWDGNGYPARLKGEHIPLHARIVCIADAFAAMLANRSFRKGMDKEQAIREIQKQKGSQFDPFIVDVLIGCLNDSPYEMKDFSFYF